MIHQSLMARRKLMDRNKLRVLGWQPRIGLEEGNKSNLPLGFLISRIQPSGFDGQSGRRLDARG